MDMLESFNHDVYEDALLVTNNWNFSLAVHKLCERDDWSEGRANKAVADYKKYMAITKALNGIQPVPNGDIDEIWHMHILDTRAYLKDCLELFGAYLHHFPYFGMLSENNRKDWVEVQSQSELLWESLTSEKLYSEQHVPSKCPQACPCQIKDGNPVSGFDFQYLEKLNFKEFKTEIKSNCLSL